MVTAADVKVLDTARIVDGVLLIEIFVVAGDGGQPAPITSGEMVALLQSQGPALAAALSAAVSCART